MMQEDTTYEAFAKKQALNAVAIIDPDADSASALAAYVIANKDFETLGTNMTTALTTFPGTQAGILMTTAGADEDQSILLPHLDTNQSAWTGVKQKLLDKGKVSRINKKFQNFKSKSK